MRTTGRLLLAVGALVLAKTVLYWFTGYEESGALMLLLSAVLAFVIGAYLIRVAPSDGEPTGDAEPSDGEPEDEEPFLPHASIWPFGVGAGAVVLANGLALGLWAIVPGTLLLAGCTLGFARQSRHRD